MSIIIDSMKTFTRKEHLVNHTRQHTGETPFKCEYCPKVINCLVSN